MSEHDKLAVLDQRYRRIFSSERRIKSSGIGIGMMLELDDSHPSASAPESLLQISSLMQDHGAIAAHLVARRL